jgi:hypothetical protein
MMDQDRERQYNPFAPAMSNSNGATLEAGMPQIAPAQAAAMADQGESAKEKAIGLAMDKGMNYGVDKGAGALSKAISGIGAGSAPAATTAIGTAGLTGAGPGLVSAAAVPAGKGGGIAAGMTGMAAAAAPVLPFVIGAMALKSIFKK